MIVARVGAGCGGKNLVGRFPTLLAGTSVRRMRRALVVLACAVVLSACGGGVTVSLPTTGQPSVPGSSATVAPTSSAAGGEGCAALTKEEVARWALMAQLFPQVRDEGSLGPVRNGTLGTYTPEGYAATLAKLQFLRGRSAPVGSPDESLDYYAKANDALAALIALPAPAASDFAAYQAVVGDVASSLAQQLGVNSALDEACPDLF